jgi:hypothetical protein
MLLQPKRLHCIIYNKKFTTATESKRCNRKMYNTTLNKNNHNTTSCPASLPSPQNSAPIQHYSPFSIQYSILSCTQHHYVFIVSTILSIISKQVLTRSRTSKSVSSIMFCSFCSNPNSRNFDTRAPAAAGFVFSAHDKFITHHTAATRTAPLL